MRRRNIPVFVPHVGCPHRCCFCDQNAISGAACPPSPNQVSALLKESLERLGPESRNAQIAFFGGSFTAVDREYMISLLEAAQPFIGPGAFSGIRLSTRPDALPPEMASLLKGYGVTAIELGAQSMDDGVLARAKRGHTAAQTREAAALIRSAGFSLGLQMMTGLPGDDDELSLKTAWELATLCPDEVRIYPTLVLENTSIARAYRDGLYAPQPLEEAVALCARLLEFFTGRGIRVIRLGLQAGELLEGSLVAGPYHPAFRELCEGKVLLERAIMALSGQKQPSRVILKVAPGSTSKMAGHGRANIEELNRRGFIPAIHTSPCLGYLQVEAMPKER